MISEDARERHTLNLSLGVSHQLSMTSVSLHDILEVEVESDDEVVWRPAKIVELLRGGRFRACVAGDADFLEEVRGVRAYVPSPCEQPCLRDRLVFSCSCCAVWAG